MTGYTGMQAQTNPIPSKQRDSLNIKADTIVQRDKINILAPAKAAFYSAVLPGLGQAYNRQYWKIPLVYAGIGAGAYFYLFNNNEYKRYRQAYFDRKNGLQDEFPQYTEKVLITAQKFYRRQRDTAMLLTILAYALNVIDANVSAHLKQWNVNDDLSFEPVQLPVDYKPVFGLQMTINIKYQVTSNK